MKKTQVDQALDNSKEADEFPGHKGRKKQSSGVKENVGRTYLSVVANTIKLVL